MLEGLTLEEYKSFSPLFEQDVFDAISLENAVNTRTSFGGTSVSSVEAQIERAEKFTEEIDDLINGDSEE